MDDANAKRSYALNWLLVAAVASSACAVFPGAASTHNRSTNASPEPTDSEVAPVQRTFTLSPPPDVGQGQARLSCGGEYEFPPALLGGPAAAEADADPAAAALRRFLTEPHQPAIYPRSGWRRVVILPQRVVFLAPGPPESPWLMVVVAAAPGRWEVDSFGECQLSTAMPDGVMAGQWWLDPSFPAPAPGDTTVPAIVRERACASGKSPAGRLLDPIVVYGQDAIAVTIPIRMLVGPADCTGNPGTSYLLRLDEPVADRMLLDAGTLPPRDASVAP